MADISKEAGISPTAGGMYRHFGSKSELLQAAIAMLVAEGRPLDDEDADCLATQVEAIRAELRRERDVLRMSMRGVLDDYPELASKILNEQINPTIAALEKHLQARGYTDPDTAQDVAAVIMCAIVGFEVFDVIFGIPPGALADAEHFVRAAAAVYESEPDP